MKSLRTFLQLVAIVFCSFTFWSATPDGWETMNPMPDGSPASHRRFAAFGFVVNNIAYIGGGYDASSPLNDFWKYNPATDTWEQKADATAYPRWNAFSFGINDKGYMGGGNYAVWGAPPQALPDFWEYNPQTNAWLPLPTQGMTFHRVAAASFVLANKGYVTCGKNITGYNNELWQWDPGTGQWAQKAPFPGESREQAGAFAFKNQGFIVGGSREVPNGLSAPRDVWVYNATLNQWTLKGSIPSSLAHLTTDLSCFTIGTKAYFVDERIVGGYVYPSLIEYNPTLHTFELRAQPYRRYQETVAFSLCGAGYLATGGRGPIESKAVHRYLAPDSPFLGAGPTSVCAGSNAAYTLGGNFPSGATISWSVSPTLSISSGQGTTTLNVTSVGPGPAWVKATITTPCNTSMVYERSDIWSGTYSSSNYPVTGPTSACANQYVYYSAPQLSGGVYNWFWPAGWTYVNGQGTNQLTLYSGNSGGTVGLRVDNPCGTGGSPGMIYTSINCGNFTMNAFPNPTSDELTVGLEFDEADSNAEDLDSDVAIQVTSSRSNKVFSHQTRKRQNRISLGHLPEGTYLLHVTFNGVTKQERIYLTK